MAQSDLMRDSLDYVRNLDLECTLADGYVCAEIAEDDFLSGASRERLVPAAYLRAWEAAHRDFRDQSDLTAEQKDLKHYRIGFTEDPDHYIVLFNGLLLPRIEAGEPAGVLLGVFGRSTKYWVDKRTLEIRKRLFLR